MFLIIYKSTIKIMMMKICCEWEITPKALSGWSYGIANLR
jgi:hypothetical protein